jgi:hypothetical protein
MYLSFARPLACVHLRVSRLSQLSYRRSMSSKSRRGVFCGMLSGVTSEEDVVMSLVWWMNSGSSLRLGAYRRLMRTSSGAKGGVNLNFHRSRLLHALRDDFSHRQTVDVIERLIGRLLRAQPSEQMSGRAWLRSKRVRCDGPVEGSGCVTKRRAAPVMHGVTCQSSRCRVSSEA